MTALDVAAPLFIFLISVGVWPVLLLAQRGKWSAIGGFTTWSALLMWCVFQFPT